MNYRHAVMSTKTQGMKAKTNLKAGIIVVCRNDNHNQTLVREAKQSLRVKTNIKAGLTVRKAGAKEVE